MNDVQQTSVSSYEGLARVVAVLSNPPGNFFFLTKEDNHWVFTPSDADALVAFRKEAHYKILIPRNPNSWITMHEEHLILALPKPVLFFLMLPEEVEIYF